ncbi:MAG TPA: hypothetical protein VIU81_06430 [Gaiellaceae bacterium]
MPGRLALALLALAILTGPASAAAPKPSDPQKRHNAADQAWAERIRVQRSDLGPGDWRVEAGDGNASLVPKDCEDPDLSSLVETGGAEQPSFSRTGSVVASSSMILQDTRQAGTAWRLISAQPLIRCITQAFQQGVRSTAGTAARVRVLSSGTVPGPALAPHFKSARVRLVIKGQAATVTGRISMYFAGRGRALAMLLVMSFDRPLRPIPDSLEHRLAVLVANRLKA